MTVDALMAVFGYRRVNEYHSVMLPIKTVPGQNAREHHMARARRVKRERFLAKTMTPKGVQLPALVTLIRYSAGTLDDDNLTGALKAIRDGVADAFGVEDNDPRLKFQYAQAPAKRGEQSVGIKIEPLEKIA